MWNHNRIEIFLIELAVLIIIPSKSIIMVGKEPVIIQFKIHWVELYSNWLYFVGDLLVEIGSLTQELVVETGGETVLGMVSSRSISSGRETEVRVGEM
jgi:hypothetical protein